MITTIFKSSVCELCLNQHPEWYEEYDHLFVAVKDGCRSREALLGFWDEKSRECVVLYDESEQGVTICRDHFNQIDQRWVQHREKVKKNMINQ
jgi:hypothetical protein